MKNFKGFILFGLMLSLIHFFSSCESVVEDPEVNFDSFYYPTKPGAFWEYQMDSIIYDDQGSTIIETTSFHKETIVDQYLNANGDSTFVIEISYKKDSSSNYVPKRQWIIEKTPQQLIRTEENLSFKKLVFPMTLDQEWESPLFNKNTVIENVAGESIYTFKNWESKVLSIDETIVQNGVTYDDAIVIQHADDNNIIERRFNVEKYDLGIGLFHRRMMILDTQCTICTDPWEEKAEAGFILEQTLINHNF